MPGDQSTEKLIFSFSLSLNIYVLKMIICILAKCISILLAVEWDPHLYKLSSVLLSFQKRFHKAISQTQEEVLQQHSISVGVSIIE